MQRIVHITKELDEFSALCGVVVGSNYAATYYDGYKWDNGKPTCEACILMRLQKEDK